MLMRCRTCSVSAEWHGPFLPLKGERIPAQGKLVFERRPGLVSRTTKLPCKGKGIDDMISASCFERLLDQRVPLPLQATP